MPNNLAVAVSADVTDLQVKFAVAKAEVSGLTSEMSKLAKQSAAGVLDPAGQAQLQQVAGDLIKARSEAAALSAEFKEMSSQTQGVGGVLEELHAKLSDAFELTGIAVAIEGVMKLGEVIENLGERATLIRTSSDVMGVTGAQFQTMQIAAEEAGVSIESLTRAAEKMNITLTEARDGSAAAVEKLLTLGVTTQQIATPTFNINALFETLHERLTDAGTKQQEMNEFTKEFGARAALVAEALIKYDGSAEGVKETMNAINGVTDEQTKKLQEAKAWWGELGASMENVSSKAFVAMTNMLPHTTGTGVGKQMIDQETSEAREGAEQRQDIDREIARQGLDNIKAGVEAFKQGTEQRLSALQDYAAAAAKYYGSDSVDVVVKANQAVVAEQRTVNDAQKVGLQELTDFGKQLNNDVQADRERLALESAKINANYVKETEKDLKELSDFAQNLDTEVTNKHAQGLKELAALDARGAKDQATAWKGAVGEIENAEGTFVSNVLSHRKGLGQSLIQLSGQMLTTEIANDVKALTTKIALGNSEKALEQGGLLYHETVQLMKTRQTTAQQAAQTGAVSTGNAARVAAESSAAAASQATASATGPPLIMADAAKAFAGTYASVAQIPYVGWIMAPGAAAAAEAAVMSQVGMASLDTGTNYVPHDMVAQIHEGEAVVPKQYNPNAGGSGAGYSEQHSYSGDVHISAFDAGSMAKMLARPGGRSSVINAAMRSYRRGAR